MTEVILLQRLYGARFERCRLALQQTLDSIANELEVKIKIKGHVGRAWVCIDVQGEDETVVNQSALSKIRLYSKVDWRL